MGNSIRTALLLGLLTALILWMGRVVGGQTGMVWAFGIAVVMNLGSYWYSDKIVLAMYRAQPLGEQNAPALYSMVRELTYAGNLPMPRIYMIPDSSPNAFATGRDPEHAVVAVTEGILRLLSSDELRGVLAHELSHVKDRDILIGSIAATLAGAVMLLADMVRWGAIFGGFRGSDDEEGGGGLLGILVVTIVAPIAAMLIQMAVSRSREFLADEEGARLSRNPMGLAGALEKLAAASQRLPMSDPKPATAHMFIVNPLTGRNIANLFSTHPPIEERIRRLRAMAV
ncbi:MAG: zinc metalloprotease HtpX [Syntrophobacteraceae bacterium]|jgi:heat shock protein HtpX